MTDPLLNQQLGPYLLQRVVGRGGMGAVYAAEDRVNGGLSAVKVLSPTLASDASFRERFTDEIESLKTLHHANIVQLLGYGEQDGQLFYAMELIDGASLQEELRRGRRFNWREVTRISIEVCAALKHAHDHGIIHRDLKPANLLLLRDDTIKLLDFGIAKLFGNTSATTGAVMGTADYMAPEQAEGKAVSPRTDLYSLGSVMYALLAGRPPFAGKSVPEVVHKVRFDAPIPICRMATDVPVEMEQLIDQLLEKSPTKRIPTALAVSHRLRAMEHALSVRPECDELDTSVNTAPRRAPSQPAISNNATVRIDASQTGMDDESHVTVTTQAPEVETGPDRFVTVAEERASQQVNTFPWQNALWLAALIGVFVVSYQSIVLLTRPPQADELYEQIVQGYDENNPRSLVDLEKPLEQFLENYPTEPRAPEITGLQRELQLYRLERRVELLARQHRDGAHGSALQHIYLDIIRRLPTAPAQAHEQLSSLLELYPDDNVSEEDRQFLDLARQQLTRLEKSLEHDDQVRQQFLRDRIARGRELAETNREAAQRFFTQLKLLCQSTGVIPPPELEAELSRLNDAGEREPPTDGSSDSRVSNPD